MGWGKVLIPSFRGLSQVIAGSPLSPWPPPKSQIFISYGGKVSLFLENVALGGVYIPMTALLKIRLRLTGPSSGLVRYWLTGNN
jgi:hypothetical protein